MFSSPFASNDFTGAKSFSDEHSVNSLNYQPFQKSVNDISYGKSDLETAVKPFEMPTFSKKLDISNMKEKLDRLLKQTDQI